MKRNVRILLVACFLASIFFCGVDAYAEEEALGSFDSIADRFDELTGGSPSGKARSRHRRKDRKVRRGGKRGKRHGHRGKRGRRRGRRRAMNESYQLYEYAETVRYGASYVA